MEKTIDSFGDEMAFFFEFCIVHFSIKRHNIELKILLKPPHFKFNLHSNFGCIWMQTEMDFGERVPWKRSPEIMTFFDKRNTPSITPAHIRINVPSKTLRRNTQGDSICFVGISKKRSAFELFRFLLQFHFSQIQLD